MDSLFPSFASTLKISELPVLCIAFHYQWWWSEFLRNLRQSTSGSRRLFSQQ